MIRLTLEAARVNAGYTQQQAGDLCGVDRATISRWETGKAQLNHLERCGFAYLYGVPVDAIFLPDELAKSETRKE